ncbi:MAG: hypothetical protein WBD02_01050 [Acidimicrobiia bacterium]
MSHAWLGNGRRIAVGTLLLAGGVSACRSNEPRSGDIPRLSGDQTDVSHPKYLSGNSSTRLWVTCGDGHYDLRNMSLDLPAPLPLEFPGAPSKTASGVTVRTEMCGIDLATRKTAYFVSPIDAEVVRDHYANKLPARGCTPTVEAATAEWAAILRFNCPSGSGTLKVSASAGAFEITMDEIPKNTPPTPPKTQEG